MEFDNYKLKVALCMPCVSLYRHFTTNHLVAHQYSRLQDVGLWVTIFQDCFKTNIMANNISTTNMESDLYFVIGCLLIEICGHGYIYCSDL